MNIVIEPIDIESLLSKMKAFTRALHHVTWISISSPKETYCDLCQYNGLIQLRLD